MRILFLNPSGSLGGAERCLLDLAASLREHSTTRGIELGVLISGEGPLGAEAAKLGMHVIRLPFGPSLSAIGDTALIGNAFGGFAVLAPRLARAGFAVPQYLRKLQRAIREFRPSIVHSNGIKMHLLAAAVATQTPVVWHVRDFIGARPLVSRAMGLMASRATAAIAISSAVARDTSRVVPRLPVSVIYDAIDTNLFSPHGPVADLDALARTDPAPQGTLRVGLVATYARWKGHEIFLKAAQRVKSSAAGPNVRFYVVGGPIYETGSSQYREEELRGLVRELGIEPFVAFVPFQDRIEEVFRALDVVVHASSRPEPFGRTIAEAMAVGKPIVATQESGAAELLVDRVDAIAVRAGDPVALAQALADLLSDAQRRESLGRAARTTAVARFSRDRLATEVMRVYRAAGAHAAVGEELPTQSNL